MITNFAKGITLIGIITATAISFDSKVNAQEQLIIDSEIAFKMDYASDYSVGLNGAANLKYQNIGLSLDVLSLNTSNNSSSNYYRSSFSNGQSRCRNASTGRFASNSNCSGGTSFDFFQNADLTYSLPIAGGTNKIILGMGTNLWDTSAYYGVAGWSWGNNNFGKLLIGKDSVGLRLAL